MDDNKGLLPLYVFVIGALFVLVSALVVLSRRHPFLVSKKLQIGALLLTLTAASGGCLESVLGPRTSCYVQVPPNDITLDSLKTDPIVIQPETPALLPGRVQWRVGEHFSFAILDSGLQLVHKSDIMPADGAFDEGEEPFVVQIPPLAEGLYQLQFYASAADSITDLAPVQNTYTLRVGRRS